MRSGVLPIESAAFCRTKSGQDGGLLTEDTTSSKHFYAFRDEEVDGLKSFLTNARGKGSEGKAILFSLRAFLIFFLFVIQLPLFLITGPQTVSAKICRPDRNTFRNSNAACQVKKQAVSSKKTSRKISRGSVRLSRKSFKYDGKSKKPKVTVTFGKKKLKRGRDFAVTYKHNRNRGKAKVIVRGKGNYRGSVTLTFRIK